MRISELQRKDIVNINDGKIIGRVIDADIDPKNGSLNYLIIDKNKYLKGLFTSDGEVSIKYEQIKKLGSDVILIEI